MTILLTNDDGIEAEGLSILQESLAGLDSLAVVAPLHNNSGVGHAITIHDSIRVREFPPLPGQLLRVGVDGTPADAVKFALLNLLPQPPALVVSGINHGPNVGVNVLYSGTLGAAFEALIGDVSSVAVSLWPCAPLDWGAVRHYARRVTLLAHDLEQKRRIGGLGRPPFCLNLNVPGRPLSAVPEMRLTQHGVSGFREYYRQDPGGAPDEYRVDGEMRVLEQDLSFDAPALEAGYASLTPLHIDLTDRSLLEHLRAHPCG